MKQLYAGSEWVQARICGRDKPMSDLGRKAADLLGDVFYGIYHLNSTSLRKANWQDAYSVGVTIYGGLSTFDDDALTRFVVLCHDRLLRGEIEGAAHNYLRLWISERKERGGSLSRRHPTIEDALISVRWRYLETPNVIDCETTQEAPCHPS